MKTEDFGEFKGGIDSNHRRDSFAVLKMDLNGQPNEGMTDLMSVRFIFAETPEDLENKRFKQIKFWLYKDDAEEYGAAIYNTATSRKRLDAHH